MNGGKTPGNLHIQEPALGTHLGYWNGRHYGRFSNLRHGGEHLHNVRFEVFTEVTMKNCVFWDVTPSGSCKNRQLVLFLVHRFLSP
jgi:hypothetical protein